MNRGLLGRAAPRPGNTVLGYQALQYASGPGDRNVALGREAFRRGGRLSDCVAIGYRALAGPLFDTTTADSNTVAGGGQIAIGTQALAALTTGTRDTAIGYQALAAVTSGFDNTAVGYQALAVNSGGTKNTAIGTLAGGAVGADENTLIGYNSRVDISGRGDTVGIGSNALCQGTGSISIGRSASTTGTGSIAIGSGATASAAGSVAIGKDSAGTAASTAVSNEIMLGTSTQQVHFPGTLPAKFGSASAFQTTVGAGGAASALPLTPEKYLKIKDSAGTTLVIPCYLAS